MSDDGFVKIIADDRDIVAADRDDVADGRDHSAGERDIAAQQRDTDANGRDTNSRRFYLDARFRQICDRILEHFARVENTAFDPADWPALDPDSLAALHAYATEQQRLSRLDHTAITGLLDDLRDDLTRRRDDRHAAAHDRRAAARDRDLAAHDRHAAADDRDLAARDRS